MGNKLLRRAKDESYSLLIPIQNIKHLSMSIYIFGLQVFPKDGINVVSVVLHSHLAGRKMKLRHIRGAKELRPIVQVTITHELHHSILSP